jgi:thymidylate synthase
MRLLGRHGTERVSGANVGMEDLPVGDTGPLYGHTLHVEQRVNKYTDYTGQGVDQLKNVIDSKNDPYGRST